MMATGLVDIHCHYLPGVDDGAVAVVAGGGDAVCCRTGAGNSRGEGIADAGRCELTGLATT